MPTVIKPFTEEYSHAVNEFNRRIARIDGYQEFQIDFRPCLGDGGRRRREQQFVALEDGAVRGGFVLNHQEFRVRGEVRRIAHYRLPVSEGVADRAYAGVGMQMLRAAQQEQPLLFALGMGGMDRPLPRMLAANGWKLLPVPFYFRVVHPQRFLREITILRSNAGRRLAAAAARWTGLGWTAMRLAQALKTRKRPEQAAWIMPDFGDWSDALWQRCRDSYALIAARDGASIRGLYPPEESRFLRLAFRRRGEIAGWAVLVDTPMQGHRQFGNLRVGTIADCLAEPADARAVIAGAADYLVRRGVDLIISNQSHAAWCEALDAAGFLRGPSNYIFAASKELARLLDPFEESCRESHLNRGDGDGPIHL